MYFILGRPKNISEVSPSISPSGDLRKKYEIAVIDDERFEPSENLRNRKFSIIELKDPNDIHAVKPYNIILCDIKGVGKCLGSELEGSQLIKNFRKFYPFKYIIAYTGQELDVRHNENLRFADRIVKKDIDIDKWEEIIDEAIEDIANPIKAWKKTRSYFLEHDVKLDNLLWLEDAYVSSIQQKNDSLTGVQKI